MSGFERKWDRESSCKKVLPVLPSLLPCSEIKTDGLTSVFRSVQGSYTM